VNNTDLYISADEEALQQKVDSAKTSAEEKFGELITAKSDEIAKLQCDCDSLRRVSGTEKCTHRMFTFL